MRSGRQFFTHHWPVVKRRRVEVSIVRPYQGANLVVESDTVEGGQILKRPKQRATQDGPEIDPLLRSVGERDVQRVRPDDAEVRHAMNGVIHTIYLSGSILMGACPDCKSAQSWSNSVLWISAHASTRRLLRLREAAAQALEGVDRQDGGVRLIERVEVRTVVLNTGLDEHADDDSEESREFRHRRAYGSILALIHAVAEKL